MSSDALQTRIAERLAAVRQRLATAAERSGRTSGAVRLIAVSKTFGADAVRAAYAAGQLDFGENRVQEALGKRAELADLPIRWHLIGPLQSNKARKVPGAFAWVHTLDRLDLLERLEAASPATPHTPLPLLLQVDLAREASKSGADESALRPLLDRARACQTVQVVGLMLVPPYEADPERVRPWFARLRGLRDALRAEGVPPSQLQQLSMGMSHDFEVAIEEGATMVRVGSAIFGARD